MYWKRKKDKSRLYQASKLILKQAQNNKKTYWTEYQRFTN